MKLNFTFSILLIALLSPALAQSKQLPILPTPDGAMLRWGLPAGVFPSGGFKLYRSGDGKQDVIPVASPQPKALALQQKWVSEGEYELLIETYKKAATDKNKLQKGIIDLSVIAKPGWARALGLLYSDSGLKAGVRYSYRLMAVNGTQETEVGRSEVVPGPTPAVPAVGQLEADLLPQQVEVQWEHPGNPNNLIVAYHIYRAEGNGPFAIVKPDPYFPRGYDEKKQRLTRYNFKDSQVKPSVVYRYAISSQDIFGRESARSPVLSVDMGDAQPLPAPALQVVTGDRSAELKWEAIVDKRVSKVLVLRSNSGDGPFQAIASLNPSQTRFTDVGLEPTQFYYYALATQSSSGAVSQRGLMQAMMAVNKTPPVSPRELKLTATETSIELRWAKNPEADVEGYHVLRTEIANTPQRQQVYLTINPIAATSYTDNLPKGVQRRYYYRIIAVNSSNVSSKPSEPASAELIDTTPPNSPTLSKARGVEGGILLEWESTLEPDIAKYELFRAGPDGKVVLVANLGPDTFSYTDKGIASMVEYEYALTAVDKNGNRSEVGEPRSARALATKAPEAPAGLKATLLKEGVKLEWNKLSTPALYVVYRADGNEFEQISEPQEATSFTDPQGRTGDRYSIRAVSAAGVVGELGGAVVVK